MKNTKFSYISIGDIHLGHAKTPTHFIIDNLEDFFKLNYKLIASVDVIFIEGDLFDKLLSNGSSEYILAMRWFYTLATFCALHKVKIRVLKGTPSHDWDQLKLLDESIVGLRNDIDFKYIPTLHIEHMSDLGIYILYVPDEYKHKSSETYEDVLKLLVEHGIEKVDIAIMHGNFQYQLPIKLESAHIEENYLNIVKHYITINHIHTSSICDRIIAPGSFDRLAHGEEEDKGCMHITINKDNSRKFMFLKNKNAKVYKTIKCYGMVLEEVIKYVESIIKKVPDSSYIRLLVDKDTHILKSLEAFSQKYSNLYIKIQTEKEDELSIGTNIIDIDEPIESFHITKDNIEGLLMVELNKHNLSQDELVLASSELESVINNI